MSLHIPFDNSYARLPERFFTRQPASPVPAPRLIAWNAALAGELGITGWAGPAEAPAHADELAQVFGGNALPQGAEPLAQAYAGHQFGGFSPQLGDGRALLLGEVVDRAGRRRDIQLKGSGPTPYSRRGDGRAWLGPVLREYLLSEFMHAAGVPTTRALAAVASGADVLRERVLPGAVLTRVAASHIRVGTFEYFAARGDRDALEALYEHTRARHYPEATTPLEMFRAVLAAQSRLVAQWMALGFIHGVMNTDNTALSGETIDYGPAAFLDIYHPATVYSSIDRQGRYAYDNQPKVIPWNMAQLASGLLALEGEDKLPGYQEAVNTMPALIEAEQRRAMGRKIGLAAAGPEDAPLINGLLELMTEGRADFTNSFAALGQPHAEGFGHGARDQFADPGAFDAFDAWAAEWRGRLAREEAPEAVLAQANPLLIPRNHLVERVIGAAEAGDEAPFYAMLAALSQPHAPPPEELTRPPEPGEEVQATFCGT